MKSVVDAVVANVASGGSRLDTANTVFTTGPCPWTSAIHSYVRDKWGVDWRSLRREGLDNYVGDTLILGGDAIYSEAVRHNFAGSWK